MKTISYGQQLRLTDVLPLVRECEYHNWPQLSWSEDTRKKVNQCAEQIQKLVNSNQPVYGVNTGFGSLSDVRIDFKDLRQLQKNILRSHAAGVGERLAVHVAATALFLRIHCLSLGYSGVRMSLLELLNTFLSSGYIPVIPSQGSVGACGDLAPLAHIGLTLIGEGTVVYQGKQMPAAQALKALNCTPIELEPKEGLALINGTQVSLAILLTAYERALRFVHASAIFYAMSLDAFEGSVSPFSPEVSALRNHPGVVKVSAYLREVLAGSEILKSHESCARIQDPYSFRCGAQVLGMTCDTLTFVGQVLEREINAVTDNPIVINGGVISNGNFHGEGLAFAADFAKIAMAEVGNISERRLDRLLDHRMNPKVTPFLADHPGVESGLMMVQVTAASLVSENKTYAHPQSVDSIPTNLDKEDHVSMSTTAARFLSKVVDNVSIILACECLAAYRALSFRRPKKSSVLVESVVAELDQILSHEPGDKVPAIEIEHIVSWIDQSKVLQDREATFRKHIISPSS